MTKTVVPSGDSGKFNLQIDGVTKAADQGDGGTTGAVVVSTGVEHTVGETAGTGTNLIDYVTTFGGACDSNGKVILLAADNKTCLHDHQHAGTEPGSHPLRRAQEHRRHSAPNSTSS